MNSNELSAEKLAERWISIIRGNARMYEKKMRAGVQEIPRPDLDDICNEITAYFTVGTYKLYFNL